MSFWFLHHRKQAGVSLLETLIAIGVSATLVAAFINSVANAVETVKANAIRSSADAARDFITQHVNCAQTVQSFCAGPGPDTELIPLLDALGNTIVTLNGLQVGRLNKIKASCSRTDSEIYVVDSESIANKSIDVIAPDSGFCRGGFYSTPVANVTYQFAGNPVGRVNNACPSSGSIATASCPTGSVAISGGIKCVNPSNDPEISYMYFDPAANAGQGNWKVQCCGGTPYAYVSCLKLIY